jgi:predicted  nucleic acid-binding Zn-ribbon protein
MPRTLDTLIELSQILTELDEARHRIEDVPEVMKELHAQYQVHKAKLDELSEIETSSEQARRAAESEAAELQTKVDHYQGQIPQVSTQREYGALLSEIDAAKERKRELEESAIVSLEALDTAKTEREALEAEFKAVNDQYQEQLAAWEADKPVTAAEIKKLEAQLVVLKEKLPKLALRQYERSFQRRGGNPMALIQVIEQVGRNARKIYSCSGCNYEVRPQVVVEIRSTGGIQMCDGCGSIFYLDESE